MADDSRIEELRRRIRKDPASLAFAQLAEELRRGQRFVEAVGVCRAGLATYPGYLSARVTLGRCLLDLNRLDDAQRELEKVREAAPENLVAVRALAEIQERRTAGETSHVSPGPAPGAAGRAVEAPDATSSGAASEVRRKPITLYNANAALLDIPLRPDVTYEGTLADVRLKPDATYEGKPNATYEAGEARLKLDTTYDRAMGEGRSTASELRLKPDPTYEGDDATSRTLAALESLLAAIHVTRASRSA